MINYNDFLVTCTTILNGLLSFGSKAINWFFTPTDIPIGGVIGTLHIAPFELLLETFFLLIVTRILLELAT